MSVEDPRARIPSIGHLLGRSDVQRLVDEHGRAPVVTVLRAVVAGARDRVATHEVVRDADELVAAASVRLRAQADRGTRPVINATGVVLHTNLGRAPLSTVARAATTEAAGASTVEFDLATRRRATRGRRVTTQLTGLVGADDALVVNNGAAALVLALAALAGRGRVVVSRGELVEIGGSFRLPEIIEAAGVGLVEVGTTNRTRADDYRRAAAAHPEGVLLLRVHPSNFAVSGFAARPAAAEVAQVARETGSLLVHDVGSGLLRDDLPLPAGAEEPSVAGALTDGADVVVASGDKLLGGPQAGLLVGRAEPVAACRHHPLARALRLDKLRLAALEATLQAYEREATDELPTWAALAATRSDLVDRAARIVDALAGIEGLQVVELDGVVGGGTLPGVVLASAGVGLPGHPDVLAERLAALDLPVVGRVADARLVLDLRTVPAEQDAALVDAVRAALV